LVKYAHSENKAVAKELLSITGNWPALLCISKASRAIQL
jgi:hypothetical protein